MSDQIFSDQLFPEGDDIEARQQNLPALDEQPISAEQRLVFMEVIEASLNVSEKTQLFRWTQSTFQYLIGHDVIVYGVKPPSDDNYRFDFLTTTLYFTQPIFEDVTAEETGLITDAIRHWKKAKVPVYVTNDIKEGVYTHFNVLNYDLAKLAKSELKNFIVHGYGQNESIVIFGRLHKPPQDDTAHLLQMIMPHLHCALFNIATSGVKEFVGATQSVKKLSKREVEVLTWVNKGKTNFEISEVLNISALTVKNHVQNIIKKLAVQNRRQAALKAVKMGLIRQ